MARIYSPSAAKDVEREMHKFNKGTLKSGKDGKGGTVKNPKQAIAIGLSEARKKGKKVPLKTTGRSVSKPTPRKTPGPKTGLRRSPAR